MKLLARILGRCRPTPSRCSTGDCCRRFPVPKIERVRENPGRFQDGEQILNMLVPLGEVNAEGKELFTCQHLQEDGDCAIYDERPRMCRNYPYGRECGWDGCTYTGTGTVSASRQKPRQKGRQRCSSR